MGGFEPRRDLTIFPYLKGHSACPGEMQGRARLDDRTPVRTLLLGTRWPRRGVGGVTIEGAGRAGDLDPRGREKLPSFGVGETAGRWGPGLRRERGGPGWQAVGGGGGSLVSWSCWLSTPIRHPGRWPRAGRRRTGFQGEAAMAMAEESDSKARCAADSPGGCWRF